MQTRLIQPFPLGAYAQIGAWFVHGSRIELTHMDCIIDSCQLFSLSDKA